MLRLSAVVFVAALCAPAAAFELDLPVDCAINELCFFQQFPDMAAGPDAVDPFCGGATYDGHDGTDIRLMALSEIALDVPVVAAADGTVAGVRDGMPDRFVETDADRAAIAGRECGNGVLLAHPEGWETQYCHMKEGSVAVSAGDAVKAGDVLGFIGASGLVQFPHVHLSVRRDGLKIDPTTGREVGSSCSVTPSPDLNPFWTAAAIADIRWQGQVIGMGLAGDALDYDAMRIEGAPDLPTTASPNLVGWAWFNNLRGGDQLIIRLETATGELIAENAMEPLASNKADYLGFAGKRGAPQSGDYVVRAVVIRDGVPTLTEERTFSVD